VADEQRSAGRSSLVQAEILIVDDEPGITSALALVFSDEGHRTRVAANGAEAAVLLRERPADVIVSDVTMPGVDGLALVKRLRSEGDYTPVVLISAAGPRSIDLGLRDVTLMPKPFDLDALLHLVESKLDALADGCR
jgi:DNA-binding NtrC family response regulator